MTGQAPVATRSAYAAQVRKYPALAQNIVAQAHPNEEQAEGDAAEAVGLLQAAKDRLVSVDPAHPLLASTPTHPPAPPTNSSLTNKGGLPIVLTMEPLDPIPPESSPRKEPEGEPETHQAFLLRAREAKRLHLEALERGESPPTWAASFQVRPIVPDGSRLTPDSAPKPLDEPEI